MAGESDRQGWLFGPGTDLLLGCGIASIALMGVQGAVGQRALAYLVPGGLIILLFALPHYGATLIRVYEDPADRARYRLFSLWLTGVVAVSFVAALSSPLLGSLLLTVYLTWSPWHYTGQNYGIALMLAGRRGIVPSPGVKRLIHSSFVLSFLLTLFAIHSGQPEGSYAPVSYEGTVFRLMPIGFPRSWVGVAIALVGSLYGATICGAVVGLVRPAGLRAAAPALVLLATQALWFAVPVPLRHWQVAGPGGLLGEIYTAYGFLWIAGFHAIQYLWITTYFATRTAGPSTGSPWRARATFLGKSALFGYAVWTLPALLFAPGLLGDLPHESGLAVMVAAMVNIHHFILDGAVWKLRDGRVAQILLRSGAPAAPDFGAARPTIRGPWIRRTAMAAGAICVAYGFFMFAVDDLGFARAMSRGDLVAADEALERLRWLGRDGPGRRIELGRRRAREGDLEGARADFERGLSLAPTARGYQSLGLLHEQQDDWQQAANAYDQALAFSPNEAPLLARAGRAWLESGDPARALPLLERAAAARPNDDRIGWDLARARREADAEAVHEPRHGDP